MTLVTIVIALLRAQSMHVLYLHDLSEIKTVTLHTSCDEAHSSLIDRINTYWPVTPGEWPPDDAALVERYPASGVVLYAIAAVGVDR